MHGAKVKIDPIWLLEYDWDPNCLHYWDPNRIPKAG